MTLSYIWCGITALSLIYGIISGNFGNLGTAAMEGAGAAVELCIGICGATCLWNGVMTLMDRCGIMEKLSRLLRPLIYVLLPSVRGNSEALKYVSANMSANLLVSATPPPQSDRRYTAHVTQSRLGLKRHVHAYSLKLSLNTAHSHNCGVKTWRTGRSKPV